MKRGTLLIAIGALMATSLMTSCRSSHGEGCGYNTSVDQKEIPAQDLTKQYKVYTKEVATAE